MIEKLLLTFGIATALSLSAPDAAAAPKGGDLTGDAFLKEVPANKLYEKFRTPDSSSKLFARWWWNGTRVCEKEIVRELDSMQRAGFGGVEINSIAFPDRYKDTLGFAQVPWLSDRWLELVDFTMREAAARGMYSDLIVGSGWPFGAETLSRDEQIKMMALGTMEFEGPCKVTVRTDDLIRSATPKLLSANRDKLSELIEVRLFPAHITELIPGTPVTFAPGAQEVTIDVPAGRHIAYVVVKHTGYMGVIHGALGARGPVLDHFNAEAVRRYLNRMSDAMRPVVGNLHDRIRSFFTDSFELEGSNWCKDIREEFQKRRGYDLYTYYPLILKKVGPYGNEIKTPYGARIEPDVMERIYRMRYDYELTLAELFKERFLDELNAWCRACGVKSRIQAYGKGCMPVESLMDVDIPECETWYHKENGEIFPDDKMSGHGYKMVNKFVASGAHLSGKNVVSCEEITNTRFVFNETLERIKITGDLSNLSGVTHSVLHGYNYSPAEAPFPGWVRYGTFYNERNPLWRFFPEWISYKARLSTVLRNSEMQTDIALMQPLVDMWTYLAPQFEPSPGKWRPFYVNTLWEAVHQNGGGCDYLTESILQRSTFADGRIEYGDRSYKALLLLEVETISPETLAAIGRYAAAGGKVFFVGSTPSKAPGLAGLEGGDKEVQRLTADLMKQYPDRILHVEAPRKGHLIGWYKELQQKYGLTPAVRIDNPQAFVNQNHYKAGNLDIFFFANYSLTEAYTLDTEFNIDLRGRRMWLWDPMTGERALLPDTGTRLKLHLEPTESRLLVFDKPVGRCDRHGRRTARRSRRTSGPALERHAQPLRRHRRRTRNRPPVRPGQGEAFRILLRPDRLPHDARRPSRRMRAHGIRRGKLRFGTLRQRRKGRYSMARPPRLRRREAAPSGQKRVETRPHDHTGQLHALAQRESHDGQVEQLQIQAGSQSLRSDVGARPLPRLTLPSRSSRRGRSRTGTVSFLAGRRPRRRRSRPTCLCDPPTSNSRMQSEPPRSGSAGRFGILWNGVWANFQINDYICPYDNATHAETLHHSGMQRRR